MVGYVDALCLVRTRCRPQQWWSALLSAGGWKAQRPEWSWWFTSPRPSIDGYAKGGSREERAAKTSSRSHREGTVRRHAAEDHWTGHHPLAAKPGPSSVGGCRCGDPEARGSDQVCGSARAPSHPTKCPRPVHVWRRTSPEAQRSGIAISSTASLGKKRHGRERSRNDTLRRDGCRDGTRDASTAHQLSLGSRRGQGDLPGIGCAGLATTATGDGVSNAREGGAPPAPRSQRSSHNARFSRTGWACGRATAANDVGSGV